MKIQFKKMLLSPLWALSTLVILASIFYANPVFLESIKLRYFDSLITSKAPTENNIYTVNIDDEALNKLGQWPPGRSEYAQIIHELYQRGAGLVVWNVLMPEADRMRQDGQLATVLKQYPVILNNVPAATTKNTPKKPGAAILNPEFADLIVSYPGIIANIPLLENNAVGVGITNTLPEIDGVNRRLPLVVSVNGQLYPSVALEVLRVAAGDPSFQIKLSELGVDKLRIPKFGPISTDELGRIWVDVTQKSKSVSLTNLPKDFEGAVVIVGPTAAGIGNPVPTAAGAIWPHELHAAVIGTMFNKVNIERPQWAQGVELILFVVLGIVLILLTRYTYVGLGSIIVFTAGIAYGSYWAFNSHLYLFDASLAIAGIILVALHAYGIKFVSEFLQKQAIKKQFAGYCSKEVVEMLQKDPDLIKRGVRKDVSVMFSDLRGFTPIGEHYGDDVAGLGKYMNGYMDAISRPIMDSKGMVIKYVGDASMHIHGAPIEDPNHARTIVAVGLEMLDAVDHYTAEMEAQGLPPAAMGWGCNTGIGFIGEMGSTDRHSYDILGDMVSTAARLEARCKAYGVLNIVGAETYNRTKNDFFYLMLDNLQPKGKSVADLIYTVLRTKGADYTKDKVWHDEMHDLYKAKKFDEAAAMCKTILKGKFGGQMDKYYEIWIERCDFMKQQALPNNWNGEFIAHEK